MLVARAKPIAALAIRVSSQRGERRGEIVDDLARVLDADGHADEPIRYADAQTLVARQTCVRCGCGPREQRLNAAEARRDDGDRRSSA